MSNGDDGGINNDSTAATVLGTIGTILWCIQLLPQIWFNWRRKTCEGCPYLMFLLWFASGVPFGAYFIVQKSNMPVQVQPHIFAFLNLIVFTQCLWYPPVKMRKVWIAGVIIACSLLFAGIEIGLVLPFRNLYNSGTKWPTTMIGIIATVLLAGGLLPPYWEIWKARGKVIGINFIFLGMDMCGAVFSQASLIVQNGTFDLLGCILYAVVIGLELGIFLCHGIYLLKTIIKYKSFTKVNEEEHSESNQEYINA